MVAKFNTRLKISESSDQLEGAKQFIQQKLDLVSWSHDETILIVLALGQLLYAKYADVCYSGVGDYYTISPCTVQELVGGTRGVYARNVVLTRNTIAHYLGETTFYDAMIKYVKYPDTLRKFAVWCCGVDTPESNKEQVGKSVLNPVIKDLYSDSILTYLENLAKDMKLLNKRAVVFGELSTDENMTYPCIIYIEGVSEEELARKSIDFSMFISGIVGHHCDTIDFKDMKYRFGETGVDLWL